MMQFHSNDLTNNGFTNCIARAMYDNIAEAPDELAFKKDDILTVLEQNTAGLEGWWLCSLRGRQGICPGNRLRLIPGMYEVDQLMPNSNREQNQLNYENKSQSFHITKKKLGDLFMYDIPHKSVESCGYNIPPINHSRLASENIDWPNSNGYNSSCCSDNYDPIPSQHQIVSKENYDVPKSINIQLTPSSSISSLSTGGVCSSVSEGESNRSSVVPEYDIPKSRKTELLPSDFQQLLINNEDYDVPSNNFQSKELSLNLNSALDYLDKLTIDICSTTSRLLGFASPNWRTQKNLEINIPAIKLTSINLKNGLHKLVEFSEGCLGNSLNAPDKGISVKLHPLIINLIKICKIINCSINSLDYLGWIPNVLSRDSQVDNNYSEDALDKLISCAKLLTDDIRQITSFIKGNSTLLFRKGLIFSQENDRHYECIRNELITDKIETNEKNVSMYSVEDKEKYKLYAQHIINQTNLLAHYINIFLQTVEHNRPPPIFVEQVKFVVLIAHQLVIVGDTICQVVQQSIRKNHIIQCCNALYESISTIVQKSKKAAQLFPSVNAVQEMVDSVVEISHISNDLKSTILKSTTA
ncbi:breast cancer anti-estrogen resistance protein 1 [Daktulosphaira vitifoliae]|uniref:breast cancer anti-estrogen resistance protein 1 n=1 Tax=Daktulosphaira vitifoliae TaxID=58002 RepID=UPI0021A9F496|nr:breast cancer anti-estrogen resistance protein 1 [Daktulosphaira vitifoliae]